MSYAPREPIVLVIGLEALGLKGELEFLEHTGVRVFHYTKEVRIYIY